MKTNDQRDHEQFQQWWRKQPESTQRFATVQVMKMVWNAWKASKRHTLANIAEDKRQFQMDTV